MICRVYHWSTLIIKWLEIHFKDTTSEHQSLDYGFLYPTIKQIQHNVGGAPSNKHCFRNPLNLITLKVQEKLHIRHRYPQEELYWSHALINTKSAYALTTFQQIESALYIRSTYSTCICLNTKIEVLQDLGNPS